MKKILIATGSFVTQAPYGQGKDIRVVSMVNALQKAGIDVSLVALEPINEESSELLDVEIHTVPVKLKQQHVFNEIHRALLVTHKARKIQKNTDAILQFESSKLGGFAALSGLSDFVLDMQDLYFDRPPYSKSIILRKSLYYIEKFAAKRAIKVIVVSNPMKEFIMKEWGVPEEKIEVVPNGYFESDIEKFKNIEETAGIISYLGTLYDVLDINMLVRTAESLNDKATLYIIGDGPAKNSIEQKVKKKKLKNIVLTGFLPREQALKLVAKSQVCLLPLRKSISITVCCPIKIFEYAALGKAMVLSNISELCTLLKENDAALVSEPGDEKEWIKNVHILLEDEKLRKKISSNAKKVVKDFTWERQGEKVANMYRNLIVSKL